MKKITLLLIFNLMSLYMTAQATTFYYEDFRYIYNTTTQVSNNGYRLSHIANAAGLTGTNLTSINKIVGDVPDATDSFFVTSDRTEKTTPRNATRDQRAISTVGTVTSVNYPIDAYAIFNTLDMSSANTLIGSNGYKYASFWTKRSAGDGDIATITLMVSTDYAPTSGSNSGTGAITGTWTALPISFGKLATTSDGGNYVKGIVDLSAYSNTTVTLALRYQGSSATYSAASRNGTFLISDLCYFSQPTALQVPSSTTTWDGNAWNPTTPNSSLDAIITGNYSSTGDLTARTLTIDNNATVTINSGHNLLLTGMLKRNSGSFTLENNAKLIQTTDVINTGTINIKRNSAPMILYDYTLWSSPMASQNLFNFSPNTVTTPTVRFYSYNTATNAFDNTGITNASTFTKGKGYAVRAPNTYNSTTPTIFNGLFTGVPNNGPITITSDYSGSKYNLIGNPYPSPIDASAFVTANSALIDGTLYFYSHNIKSTGTAYESAALQYATWNLTGTTVTASASASGSSMNNTSTPNGTIQVGQAFIVKATNTAAANITFNNTMRTVTGTAANADQFFKMVNTKSATASIATEKHRLWLDLNNANGDGLSQLLVGYVDGATNEADNLYDGEEFGTPQTSLTSLLNGKNYTIQGRALPFTDTDTVPLAFKAATNGTYTITLNKTDGVFATNQEVLLKDNVTGTVKNLKTGGYTFTATAGTSNSRFELAYSKSAINAIGVNSAITAVKKQGVYQVNTDGAIMKEITVYDMQGNEVFKQQNINSTTSALSGLPSARGVLIIKVTTDANQTQTIKIIN